MNTLAGGSPQDLGEFDIKYDEQCFTMYLPIYMNDTFAVPDRFQNFIPLMQAVVADYKKPYKYIYLTVKNNYAKANQHQNREGVHVDGYLTDDENYVFVSGEPTEYIEVPEFNSNPDDAESLKDFEDIWQQDKKHNKILLMKPNHLYKLDKTLHASPIIKKNHVRLFVKISFSNNKFNLKGNAHNYLFNYNWEMYDRGLIRNNPTTSNKDSVEETSSSEAVESSINPEPNNVQLEPENPSERLKIAHNDTYLVDMNWSHDIANTVGKFEVAPTPHAQVIWDIIKSHPDLFTIDISYTENEDGTKELIGLSLIQY